jgi:hypothetical protein
MSQRTSEAKEINGVKYEVFMLPPKISLSLMEDLGKVLGPAFGALVDRSFSSQTGDALDSEVSFTGAAKLLFQNLEKGMMQDVILKLASVTHADGTPLDKIWEVHFLGKMGSLFKWLGFALRTQYSDFLEEVGIASGLNNVLAAVSK